MSCAGSLEDIVSKRGTLTHEETCRALRLSIAAEYDAVALYEKIAERTDDPLVKKVMLDVADEEKVHAGEFLEALKKIEPDEAKHYRKGSAEVKEMGESKLSPKFSAMLAEGKYSFKHPYLHFPDGKKLIVDNDFDLNLHDKDDRKHNFTRLSNDRVLHTVNGVHKKIHSDPNEMAERMSQLGLKYKG